jgi:hypothetical protein
VALPTLDGKPIRVAMRRSLGPYLASTSIRKRLIFMDGEVLERRGDFERILIHELFHFAWVRLPNAVRHDWEAVLRKEFARRVRGELGWSSEWRKNTLTTRNARARERFVRDARWRRYACESFCDTAAWMFARIGRHDEFTLGAAARRARRGWFQRRLFPGAGLRGSSTRLRV